MPGGGVGTPADYVLMLLCCQVATLVRAAAASRRMRLALTAPRCSAPAGVLIHVHRHAGAAHGVFHPLRVEPALPGQPNQLLRCVWSAARPRRSGARPTRRPRRAGFRTQGVYLPWVMLAFAVLIGQNPVGDLIGIAAGHLFYFLIEVVPQQYGKQILTTPQWLCVAASAAPLAVPVTSSGRMTPLRGAPSQATDGGWRGAVCASSGRRPRRGPCSGGEPLPTPLGERAAAHGLGCRRGANGAATPCEYAASVAPLAHCAQRAPVHG